MHPRLKDSHFQDHMKFLVDRVCLMWLVVFQGDCVGHVNVPPTTVYEMWFATHNQDYLVIFTARDVSICLIAKFVRCSS